MWLRLALAASLLEPVLDFDHTVQRMVQENRTPVADRVMNAVMKLGEPEVVFGGLLALACFGGPAGPATARAAVLALIPANIAVEVVKRSVNRARPDGERKHSNASFPSSHAANAFALAVAIGSRYRRAALPLLLLATAVAWARVYLNRHFASDVLVGVFIGVGSAIWVGSFLGRRAARSSAKAKGDGLGAG